MRTILTPPALPGAALDELRSWLAINGPGEDGTLSSLLRSALDLCEAFTGEAMLEAEWEDILPAAAGRWQSLSARPVQAVTLAEGIPADGPRFPLDSSAYAVELDADGGARFRLFRQGAAGRVAVRFTAGMAEDWTALPSAIRHGAIRLAAHLYRRRDEGEAEGGASPPAAVAALWRPWRRVRLP